jgi:peptide/nickel transport system substrate-binding protein
MRRNRFSLPGWLAAVLAVTALVIPWTVAAQEATPADASGPTRSLTREELAAQVVETLQFTEAATPGGIFVDAAIGDIQTLHPFLVEEQVSAIVADLMFESLVGSDLRNGQPGPTQLADWWEIAPDGVTYTFHLNKDAKWHDGVDVTADDVQFSFDALANPETGSAYTGAFLDAVESWRVLDEHTFEVVAREPLYTFLFDLVATYIIPRHIWESVPVAEWRTDPGATGSDPARVIGSGPFKFQEWRPGESVTVVRNDEYHGKVPYLDAYTLRIWPDQTGMVNALLNGEIDTALLEPADIAAVEGAPGIEVAHFPTRFFTYYELNLDPEVTTLWQDQRVRQALMYAIDRQSIVENILFGYGEVAQGTQPAVSYAYAPDQVATTYTFDPDKASALLSDAGWTDTDGDGIVDKDGQSLSFELLYGSGSPKDDQLVTYLQDAWRAIGVDAQPVALEGTALIEATTTNPTFEMALYSFGWDASFIQDAMFGCDQYQVGFNDMRYCNEELDAINDEAKRTFDEAARRELLIEASNIVNNEQPVGLLFFVQDHVAYSDRLQNYAPNTWGIDFRYVWIDEG